MRETITIDVAVQVEYLSEQLVRARPLGPWKLQVVGQSWEELCPQLSRRLRKLLLTALPTDLFAGSLPATVQSWRCSVELPPQQRDPRWTTPLQIELNCFRWQLDNGQCVVRVPAVHCILFGKPADLGDDEVARQARIALLRLSENRDLASLSSRFARRSYDFRSLKIDVPLNPADESDLHGRKQRKKTATLRAAASDLTQAKTQAIYGLDEKAAELADHFISEAPQSVLLVGPAGVGKTSLVVRLAQLAKALGLAERRIWSTSGARIVSGMSGLGMWQQRCSKLIRQAHASRAIIHFGSLFELLEAGKIDGQPGVASMVRQSIARGKLLAIAECTPEQLAFIERQDPMLLRAFNHVEFKEPSEAKVREILRAAAQHEQTQSNIGFDEQALEELYRLHTRFATYSALPAVALQLMRTMADSLSSGVGADSAQKQTPPPPVPSLPVQQVQADAVARAFARQTGLPEFLVDDSIALDLSAIEQQLSELVIGQSEPVEIIVDLLATLKARLVRPGRPLASLMFIGPTGVGKTEMAKAIARLLYSDSSRMIRIDMSEYASPWSAVKLIGKSGEGDGTLTSPIREQPFSVVLLDEFEKADPNVFDLLLQMLGEGRLTDSQGRLADFRNAVVIMTSNLGAETFRQGGMGFADSENGNWREHFQREVQKFVRPEFLGRLDRIVPFRPLSKPIVKRIAYRELDKLRQRPGLKYSNTSLRFDDAAVELLCDLGYQPKYGARPLRRAIEQHVAVPLANALSNLSADHTWVFDVTAEAGEFSVQPRKQLTTTKTDKEIEKEVINNWQHLGRMARTARHCGPVRDLQNELERTQRLNETLEKKVLLAQGPGRLAAMRSQIQQGHAFIDISRRILAQLLQLIDRISSAHLRLMCSWHRGESVDWEHWRMSSSTELTSLRQATEDVVRRRLSASEALSLVISGRNEQHLQILWKAYRQLAADNDWACSSYVLQEFNSQYTRRSSSSFNVPTPSTPSSTASSPEDAVADDAPHLRLRGTSTGDGNNSAPPLALGYLLGDDFHIPPRVNNVCGLALQFKGNGIESWLEDEQGIVHFYDPAAAGSKRRQRYRIMVFPMRLAEVALPENWLQPAAPLQRDPRRVIDLAAQFVSSDHDVSLTYPQGKPHEGLLAQLRKEHERALWIGIGYTGIPVGAQLRNLDIDIPF